MSIETAIVWKMRDDSTIDGLVSTRIKPGFIPQGKAYPAICYQQITGNRSLNMSGPIGPVESTWQINCWATSLEVARTLADAVRKGLNGIVGTWNGTVIKFCELTSEGDLPEPMDSMSELKRYGKRLEFRIWFVEVTA